MRKLIFISLIVISTLFFVGHYKDNLRAESRQAIEMSEEATKDIGKKYELIISPCGKPSMVFRKFRPLANYLSKSTGLKIDLVVLKDFNEFVTKVKNQKAGFLYMDPAIYLDVENLVNKDYLYVALCGFIDKYQGRPIETGCIITRNDSNIKTIKDVKGKRVIFGPENSATKWIAARKYFIDNGIDLEKDLAGYSFGGSCIDIVLDIFFKKSDTGCVRTLMCPVCNSLFYYKNFGLDVAELSHVAQTSPVITWVFTCTNNIDEKDMGKVVDALLRMSELDSQKRETFSADIRHGFIKVKDSDFDDLRKMGE